MFITVATKQPVLSLYEGGAKLYIAVENDSYHSQAQKKDTRD